MKQIHPRRRVAKVLRAKEMQRVSQSPSSRQLCWTQMFWHQSSDQCFRWQKLACDPHVHLQLNCFSHAMPRCALFEQLVSLYGSRWQESSTTLHSWFAGTRPAEGTWRLVSFLLCLHALWDDFEMFRCESLWLHQVGPETLCTREKGWFVFFFQVPWQSLQKASRPRSLRGCAASLPIGGHSDGQIPNM